MAYTYSSTPVLSKIKIGNDYYYLKDADVRSILDGFNNAIVTGQLGTVSQQNKLVYSQDIKSYVDSAIAVGLVIDVVTDLPEATADQMGKIFLIAQAGGEPVDAYDEYIVVRTGQEANYSYSWEKIGDTRIDLSGIVSDVKYTASSHTLQQQKGGSGAYTDIHTFGAFADANQGEGTLTDYVTGVSSATVTAAGSISTLSVIDSVGTLPTKAADTFSANKPTVIDVTKFNGGSKAADQFTAASITAKPTAAFAQAGILASVGSGVDAETLIITNATTAQAVTDVTLSGGSFTEGAFTAATLSDGFYTAGTAATFSEGAFTQGSLPTTKEVTPTFTGSEVNATVTLSTGSKTITVNPKASE